jgi:hypothetical protein
MVWTLEFRVLIPLKNMEIICLPIFFREKGVLITEKGNHIRIFGVVRGICVLFFLGGLSRNGLPPYFWETTCDQNERFFLGNQRLRFSQCLLSK